MMKNILFAMSLLGLLTCCTSKKAMIDEPQTPPSTQLEEQRTMPQGRLKYFSYNRRESFMPVYGKFELKLNEGGKGATFSFYSRGRGDVTHEVSDTLLDAVRRIIEEEQMYTYEIGYSLAFKERILDGYSWDFLAIFEGKETVSSRGNNAEPGGNGLRRMENFLMEAAKKCDETNEEQ